MEKSPDAFRTISEVAEYLQTPAHVLRFWESRFPQVRPVKRAGGRRYYRPADVALLAGIRRLLHDEGLTIRGVQKILREQGVRHVASLGEAEPAGLDVIDAAIDAVPVFETPIEKVVILHERTRPAPPVAPEAIPAEPEAEAPVEATLPEDSPALAADADLAEPAAPLHEAPQDRAGAVQFDLFAALEARVAEAVAASRDAMPVAEPLPDAVPEPADNTASEAAPAEQAEPAVTPEAEAEATPEPADRSEAAAIAGPEAPLPDESTPPPPEAEEPGPWFPTLLRRVPRGALDHRQDDLQALRARLVALRARMAGDDRPARH